MVAKDARRLLDRFGELVSARDPAVLDLFQDDALLVGSEVGESAHGRIELQAFFEHVFAWPASIRWEWNDLHCRGIGDAIWCFAEGEVVATSPDGSRRAPYRMSCVLIRNSDTLRFSLFHGAEPAAKQSRDGHPQGRAGGPPRPPRGNEETWGGPAFPHEAR